MNQVNIMQKIQGMQLPPGDMIVIGSGVLDALGLRAAHDIDLVVRPALFDQLAQDARWTLDSAHGEAVLRSEQLNAEAWLSLGSDCTPNFDELKQSSITIKGIMFTSPAYVLKWKRQHMRPKDIADIELLEAYLARVGHA